MKILIDARMYGLENAGIGRYLINLLGELEKTDKENQYLILLRKKYYDLLEFPKNWDKYCADFRHYTIAEQFLLPRILKKQRADIVHFPHFNVTVFWRGNFVVTIHDMTIHKQGIEATNLPMPLYFLKKILYRYVFKQAMLRSKAILTPSATTKSELLDYFNIKKEKITVIYEGYKKDFGLDGVPVGEINILSKYNLLNKDYFFYVGNAYPHKNLERAIKSVIDVNENRKVNVQFVIAGLKDSFIGRLEKITDKYKGKKYIKIIGFVSDLELAILYKHSLGFLYPSLSEGFGLQGLEAISCGTIILCSNIPIFREIYQGHAFYFDPKDTGSISSTLYSVAIMNRVDKNKYIKSAQDFIKKYSWQKMASETLKVYEGCSGI